MTNSLLDDHEVTLDCPKCSGHITEKIGRLKNDPTLKCPTCGTSIEVRAAKLKEAITAVEKRLGDLAKRFSRTIKIGH